MSMLLSMLCDVFSCGTNLVSRQRDLGPLRSFYRPSPVWNHSLKLLMTRRPTHTLIM